jgi:hypothetical protein
VALGGHCLVRPGEPPSIAAQRRNLRRALEAIAPILLGEDPWPSSMATVPRWGTR